MASNRPGLLGRKVGMTQIFLEGGDVVPVTVVEAGPCHVIQLKSVDGRDGYQAVQLGFAAQKTARLNGPQRGHLKAFGIPSVRYVREIRLSDDSVSLYSQGGSVDVSIFNEGEKLDVTGTSKGRGFAGVMKKFGFRGSLASHGTHEFFRHGGSIGTRLTPGMVLKGKKMPGHLGAKRVTIQNLVLVRIDAERNLLFIKGAVPGPVGGFLIVRKAVRAAKRSQG